MAGLSCIPQPVESQCQAGKSQNQMYRIVSRRGIAALPANSDTASVVVVRFIDLASCPTDERFAWI
jgi:hypothetical protein